MPMEFEVQLIDDVAVLELPCEYLDAGNYEEFVSKVDELLDVHTRVVMDFQRVRFIDSSGIGTLLFAQRKVSSSGGTLRVCCVRPTLRDDLHRLQIHRLLDVHETREDAVKAALGK